MEQRLQKLIASAGLASRRAAEEMILRGEITVNGKQITELGTKADPTRDHIRVNGKLISPLLSIQSKRYFLINKPRGVLCAVSDPRKRPLITDLVPPAERKGLHPVGRLDFNSEGLIVLTNDGDLTQLLTRGGVVPKIYRVKVKGAPSDEQIKRLERGVRIGGQQKVSASIKLIERTRQGNNTWYEVMLRQGKNQQIRKMFEVIGHSVVKLHRVQIGHVSDRGLAPGAHRELRQAEVQRFFSDYQPSKGTARPDKPPRTAPARRPT